MTWASAKQAGSEGGALEFELIIEGYEHSWVTGGLETGVAEQWTESDGTTTHDARTRHHGLRGPYREEWQLTETGRLAEAFPDLGELAVTIDDVDQSGTEQLTAIPSFRRSVTSGLTPTDTSIPLDAPSSLFSVGDIVHVGQEAMGVEAVSGGTTLTVVRGVLNSQPLHYYLERGATEKKIKLSDRPEFFNGRRVELHAYGETETSLSSAAKLGDSASLVWRGVIRGEPLHSDALSWRINIDPITQIFEQDVGTFLDKPLRLRGVHYPAALQLQFSEVGGGKLDEPVGSQGYAFIPRAGPNAPSSPKTHFETQDDFVDELQTEIDDQLTSTQFTSDMDIRVKKDPELGWVIEFQVKTTADRGLIVTGGSWADGVTLASATRDRHVLNVDTGETSTTVADGNTYRILWSDMLPNGEEAPADIRFAPRHCGHTASRSQMNFLRDPDYLPPAPTGELAAMFVQEPELVTDTNSFSIADALTFEEDGVTRYASMVQHSVDVIGVDTSTGKLTLGHAPETGVTASGSPKLELQVGQGDLGDFTDNLQTLSKEKSSLGVMPRIRTDDLDQTAIDDTLDHVIPGRGTRASPDWQANRLYQLRKSTNLKTLMEHEARLIGCFWHMTTEGALALRRNQVFSDGQSAAVHATIQGADERTSRGRSTFQQEGIINVVRLRTGWDPSEGEFLGGDRTTRHVSSISAYNKRRTLKIEPKVEVVGQEPSQEEDIHDIAKPTFAMFALSYQQVRLRVTMRHFDVRVGDLALVTAPQIPYNGERGAWGGTGVNQLVGRVVARRWNLPDGELTIHVTNAPIAGYAPAVDVDSASDNGDGTWDITMSTTATYAPTHSLLTGVVDLDYFAVDDWVTLYPRDNDTRPVAQGQITSINSTSGVVSIDFTGTNAVEFVGVGNDSWIMHYGGEANVNTDGQSSQFRYMGLTSPAGTRANGDEPREFS